MKKYIFVIAAILAAALLLSSCSGDENAQTTEGTTAPPAETATGYNVNVPDGEDKKDIGFAAVGDEGEIIVQTELNLLNLDGEILRVSFGDELTAVKDGETIKAVETKDGVTLSVVDNGDSTLSVHLEDGYAEFS